VPTYPSFVDALPITRAALEFAASRHAGQVRDTDRAPFILHPLEVAHLLQGRDYPDHVIAAGVLHDVLEDTDVTHDELVERFGDEVAGLVASVSEPDPSGTYAERKARLREVVAGADTDAAAVFAADKVAKAREFRLGLVGSPGAVVDTDKLEHYWACLDLLEQRLGPVPLVGQLRFELEALALLPPSVGDVSPP
jgi:(p)ppGpp synthase/HD superfamily hydrolase